MGFPGLTPVNRARAVFISLVRYFGSSNACESNLSEAVFSDASVQVLASLATSMLWLLFFDTSAINTQLGSAASCEFW
jgi:hypothetical protein